jgi:ribosome biogenesis GTPase
MKKYRVISTQKQTALVINTETSIQQACFFARKIKPICGDFVEIQANKNEYVISKIHTQTNIFSRANHKGLRQNIAANVDNQIIVVAVKPEHTQDLINRYLIAAHLCEMNPIILFNKNDIDEHFFDDTKKLYQSLGYTVLTTSTKDQSNFDELTALMANKTSIFVGMSGVGKSSISELILKQPLKTGEISKKTGKGSHVTSVTHMYAIPDSVGFLIDSPGVWEYGLWKMTEHEIAAGFPEINAQLGTCKFSNCTHTHEPKCGIKLAVEKGEINPLRYKSYLRIIDSMKYWD